MKVLPRHEANAKLGEIIALLKAQGSRVYEKCAASTTHIMGGNALWVRCNCALRVVVICCQCFAIRVSLMHASPQSRWTAQAARLKSPSTVSVFTKLAPSWADAVCACV